VNRAPAKQMTAAIALPKAGEDWAGTRIGPVNATVIHRASLNQKNAKIVCFSAR
jgi:hypothetical protein